jgi:WD40 repeat protein
MSFDAEEHQLLLHLLQNQVQPSELPHALAEQLTLSGAITLLQEEASPQAIETLKSCVLHSPLPAIQQRALNALLNLTRKHPEAIQALYHLALEFDCLAAIKGLASRPHLPAPSPQQAAALALLQKTKRPFSPTDLQALTEYFLASQPATRQRLLKAAITHLPDWFLLAHALDEQTPQAHQQLLQAYSHFDENQRALVRNHLLLAFTQGQQQAGESLCECFLQHEDTVASQMAQQANCAPHEPTRRALFYFLSEQWQAYQQFDFNHSLLISAYEQAPQALRRRILNLSRYSGQVNWLETNLGNKRQRLLRDLSDADWQTILQQLQQQANWPALWQIALTAPPLWSVRILLLLAQSGWRPPTPTEQDFFTTLLQRCQAVQAMPPQPERLKTLPVLTNHITCLALSPGGRLLIAGSTDHTLQRWQLPQGKPLPPIYAPAADTRALAFSPSGEFLVAALNDHTLRIFRHDDAQVVKTLTGHRGMVRGLAITPDNRTLFSASFDGSVRAWRFPLGPEQHKLAELQQEWFGLALSADGQHLLASGSQGLLQVWSWPTTEPLHTISTGNSPLLCLTASPSGQLCASAGRDPEILLHNFISGRQHARLSTSAQTTALSIHPNEQLLFSGDRQGTLTFWNISNAQPVALLPGKGQPIISLLLTPNGQQLISSEANGQITLWKLDNLLLARQPIENEPQSAIQQIQTLLEQTSPTEQGWLALRLELLRWKARFDIALAEPMQVQLSDFDIIIE